METGYRAISICVFAVLFSYNGTIKTMADIKKIVWNVGEKRCHCTLLRRSDKTFYIRIQGLNQPLFKISNPIAELFFRTSSIFVFDSSRIPAYNVDIHNSSTEERRKPLQDAVKSFEVSINNYFSSLIPFRDSNQELGRLFEDLILSILNEPLILPDKKEPLMSSDKKVVVATDIEGNIQNFTKSLVPCLQEKLINSSSFSTKQRDILNHPDNVKRIKSLFDSLILGNLNYSIDLAQDTLVSKPFRLIYYEIQKLGLALNVDVSPIDAAVTSTKNALAARARSFISNRYTIFALLSTAGLGALAKWRPTISWPSIAIQPSIPAGIPVGAQ
jgi:hypothetical protein